MELKNIDYIRKIVTKSLLGEASEEEMKSLEEWLEVSDENRQLYKKMGEPEFLTKAIGDNNIQVSQVNFTPSAYNCNRPIFVGTLHFVR